MSTFHPLQPAYLADPYPYLARLRSRDPVFYSPDLRGYILTRYADCASVLRDDEHLSSDPGSEGGGVGEAVRMARRCAALGEAPILANSDGPDHARLRAAVSVAFRARAVLEWRGQAAETLNDIFDALPKGEPFDLMASVAQPFAVLSLLQYIGVPPEHYELFRRCVVAIMRARLEGDRDSAAATPSEGAARALDGIFGPGEGAGLAGELSRAVEAGSLTRPEMLMLIVHVATAGNAATSFAIGNAALSFARHPDAWEQLQRDRELMPSAIEECLRFESPTHVTSRFARDGASVGGRRVPAGKAAHLVISAANRDPEAFPDPDTFDISRAGERQLAFGVGVHACLGAALGRLDLELVLAALLDRFERLELASHGYEPGGTLFLRGPRRLVLAPTA